MKTQKKTGLALACSVFCTLGWGAPVMAQNDQVEYLDKEGNFFLSAGVEAMDGDTTYRIGYPITLPNGVKIGGYFPFSELEWPLDVELAGVKAGFKVTENITVQAGLKKNISDPDDNMVDRDWLTSFQPSRLDVYSESYISDFSALIVDAELQWTFARSEHLAIYTGAGYMYQNFDYDANLIRQYSPSGIPGFDFVGDGSVGITYEIEYHIPYLLIGMDTSFVDNLIVSGKLGISPYAVAEDEDNHLLRENGGKISEGDLDGYAAFFDLSARYQFFDNFFAEIGGSFMRIEMDGKQDQSYVLAGPIGEVDMEVESDQYSVYFNIGFKI